VNGEATGQIEPKGPSLLAAREERRRTRRVKVQLAARLKPYYQSQHLSSEIRPTNNISRGGIHFTTLGDRYSVGMHILVRYPNRRPLQAPAAKGIWRAWCEWN